jgi:hypothetical protein
MITQYLLLTESALELILNQRLFDAEGLPRPSKQFDVHQSRLDAQTTAFATGYEPQTPYSALVDTNQLRQLVKNVGESVLYLDLYNRIARVVKALKTPPVHLPRSWSEYHHKNMITFFALPREAGNYRWIVDLDSAHHSARFGLVTSEKAQRNLDTYAPTPWPNPWPHLDVWIAELRAASLPAERDAHRAFVEEVDLRVIGSRPVTQRRTYEQWLPLLTAEQQKILEQPLDRSIRIIGPAGSGKTLILCMRAAKVAKTASLAAQAKTVLVVTHSWAMAERIDGVLQDLLGGEMPQFVTVLPLLYILQLRGPRVGSAETNVVGDDSRSGRLASIGIINEILSSSDRRLAASAGLSSWVAVALVANGDGRQRGELVLNLYEEFMGVLAAGGVSFDDDESLQRYLSSIREDWMPPFTTQDDRKFVLEVYRRFLALLADRGAITTDQLVLDSIRVLETFTWRMKRESEGYDFIFVDELQLFDSQERLAIYLLARSSSGIPITTAEDPSQAVFSALNSRAVARGVDLSIYLQSVHRFEPKIFNVVKFIYEKFPLNTVPLKIDAHPQSSADMPVARFAGSDFGAIEWAARRANEIWKFLSNREGRLCVVTLGDVDQSLRERIGAYNLQVVRLQSFDDVEQLTYRKRAVVISPWQFIGGTQFSHVIVVSAGESQPLTSFARLRELTSLYLACSRAVTSLEIICGDYVPQLVREAVSQGILAEA